MLNNLNSNALNSFEAYRNKFGHRPLTAEEARIQGLIMRDQGIVKAIGARMLTNDTNKDDILGLMLMSTGGGVL